ncbi:acyloxyacyl hydrolase [Pseudocolwellia sp. HL-MZ19]|uniref:acyloxyacyl hydrolase n=1 Tax=Pseudocolwellia sp. HL-MZ19 TaxID=3400846 RepID=UPI003CF4270A
MNTLKAIKLTILALLIATGLQSPTVQANSNVIAVNYIHGESDVDGIKIAYQRHIDYLKQFSSKLNLYFETSINFWEYGAENKHDTNFVLAMSPVVRYQIGSTYNNPLYAEFGIGISLLDDTQFAGKNVSTHYQFEDRLGLVYKFGKSRKDSIALRYLHYSNAGFKSPNPGLDFISFSYSTTI